ncbi:hexosaminidase [Arachidicoccus rhizosphaerae]|uniref:beta-N-acetylhexosaminidase n=1 Tax=Arachidicoccus rhizosphaerae TaxID=551991 RepID=A0A1H4C9P1_9BACT|nr:beta-N-acetylhexosaminidase [Arachidicoccus rhizosphaerae]SEA57145.1 hexosaminidase [Arachidicoccus rhizosphaerae]
MKHLLLSALSLLILGQAMSQDIHIIPEPESVTPNNQSFVLSSGTKILGSMPEKAKHSIDFFNQYLSSYYQFQPVQGDSAATAKGNVIYFQMEAPSAADTTGAYTLHVGKDSVIISAANEEGFFYGMQTLIQLLPTAVATTLTLPGVDIQDAPQLGYRGMMLDCCRHFMPVDFVKKFIDYLALHKLNRFHWHLTDDQGWRIEIKKYPKLTQMGAWRNGTIIGHYPGTGNDNQKSGGYYTQDQIREIIQYAADRYITIIPEIEMPGHASAAIAAYPELSTFPNQSTVVPEHTTWAGSTSGKQVQQTWGVFPDVFVPSNNTFKFLQDVIDEVMALFPSKYIHIGGDECPKDYWKKSDYCQQLMKNAGLQNEEELQSYFIKNIEKYVVSKGHQIIGWDEILEGGLAPQATVMSWRGEKGGIEAAKQNHHVIMSPNTYLYFDYAQNKPSDSLTIGGFLPISKVYSFQPYPTALPADQHSFILGVQANLWTEYIASPAKAEYMIFPRISALSEVGWSKASAKNYDDFKVRLQTELQRYQLWGVNYCKNWDM